MWTSDHTVRIAAPHGDPQPDVLRGWEALLRRAASSGRIPGVLDVVPAATCITLVLDPAEAEPASVSDAIEEVINAPRHTPEAAPVRLIDIPVVYGGRHGPDLADLAASARLSEQEAIALHASPEYRVDFLGFSPGFAYLSGLPIPLHAPRLPTPRPSVAAGSVGIAGERTGIYPSPTPGGWRLIGRTPLVLFDAERDEPSLLRAGDRVRFVPITEAEYDRLSAKDAAP